MDIYDARNTEYYMYNGIVISITEVLILLICPSPVLSFFLSVPDKQTPLALVDNTSVHNSSFDDDIRCPY